MMTSGGYADRIALTRSAGAARHTVAIKVLPAAFARDADRLSRFEREAKAVSPLSHPNILAIHDTGTHDGQMFVVTELLEGETPRARVQQGPMPVRKATEMATQIARGLAAAHDKGLIHRDLKPETVSINKVTACGGERSHDAGEACRPC